MDFGRILNMILNRFFRRAVNTGITKGVDYAARRGNPASQTTPADHKQAAQGRELAKRARQAARITRRLGR